MSADKWPVWPRLSRNMWFLIMIVLVAIPMISPLGLPIPFSPRTIDFKNAVDKVPAGSGVLIGLQIESISTAVEIRDFWQALIIYLIKRDLKIVFSAFGPAGALSAESIVQRLAPDTTYNYKYGVDYVILPYLPGDEIAIAATATSFRTAYATDNRGTPLADIPLMQRFNSLSDMGLSICYFHIITYAEMFVRQWPVKYNVPFIVLGSFNVISTYYPKYVQGNIEGSQQYAEWEKLVNIPGSELVKLDAMNLQAFLSLGMIFVGLAVSAYQVAVPRKLEAQR